MRIIKSAIRSFVRKRLARSALDRRPALIVLLYHAVDPDPPPYLACTGVVTHPAEFEDHIRWIRRNYDVVALSEGIRRLRSGELRRTSLSITFDDGLSSCVGQGLGILEEHGVPCTLFVNRAFLNGRQQWLYEVAYLEAEHKFDVLSEVFGPCEGPSFVEYLRWSSSAEVLSKRDRLNQYRSELSSMPSLHFDLDLLSSLEANPLVEIGNHSVDHPRFSRLEGAQQARQIADNDRALAGLGNYRRLFAVPFGTAADWDFRTVSAAASEDHEFISALGGVNFIGRTGVDIRRIPCDGVPVGGLEERLISAGLGLA